jgi:hypothetical protein
MSLLAAGRRTAVVIAVVILVIVAAWVEPALAQCPMCKQSLAGAHEAAAGVKQLNLAIVVLLVPPVAIFAGLFAVIYRSGRSRDQ